jgi:hypothetical protein
MSSFADILEERFGAGQPILTEDVLAAFPDEPRSTVFYRLKAEVESGGLARFDRGVYYVPERAELFGRTVDVPLDPERVIARKYLERDGEVIGFVSGLALENRSRVSNQVPAVLEITTNAETNRRRRVRPFGGYREVVLKRPRVPVTAGNVDALEAIDLVENVDVASLDESELDAYRSKVAKADWATVVECLSAYPKKTVMKYLKEVAPAYVPA